MRMHVFLAVVLSLAVCADNADARRRRHAHYGHRSTVVVERPTASTDAAMSRAARPSAIAPLIPRDWSLEPADPNRPGKRFTSPSGDASVAFLARSANDVQREQYLKEFAFADGEEVTYLRGARDWLAVSGLRGERIFYRKAVLACGESQWRHVMFEYPAEAKRDFDRLVTSISRALDQDRDNDCNIAGRDPSVSAPTSQSPLPP
jgi:hypothetical protein